MAVTLRYMLYDTVTFGATANLETILFQVVSGGDATHGEQITNNRGPGVLPQDESFEVDWIGAIVNSQMNKTDVDTLFNSALLEIRISDFTVIKAPLAMFVAQSAYGGQNVQAAAADMVAIGLLGDGYELDKHLMLKGGQAFKVRILQGPAVTAGQAIYIVLGGLYTMAGQG